MKRNYNKNKYRIPSKDKPVYAFIAVCDIISFIINNGIVAIISLLHGEHKMKEFFIISLFSIACIVLFLIDNRPGQRTIIVPILDTAFLIGSGIVMIKIGWDFIIWALPIELCFIIVSSVFFNKYSYKLDFIIRKIKENRKK